MSLTIDSLLQTRVNHQSLATRVLQDAFDHVWAIRESLDPGVLRLTLETLDDLKSDVEHNR